MKQSRPSNVSSDVEPPPTALPDVDAAPPRQPDGNGAEGFVVASFEAHSAEVFGFPARSIRDGPLARTCCTRSSVGWRRRPARSAVVAPDGTVYVLAVEPEPNSSYSATILAITPGSHILAKMTNVEP